MKEKCRCERCDALADRYDEGGVPFCTDCLEWWLGDDGEPVCPAHDVQAQYVHSDGSTRALDAHGRWWKLKDGKVSPA